MRFPKPLKMLNLSALTTRSPLKKNVEYVEFCRSYVWEGSAQKAPGKIQHIQHFKGLRVVKALKLNILRSLEA